MGRYEGIYREFRPKIFRYLRNLCGESDAEDLTQAVFLRVGEPAPRHLPR